MRGISKRFGHHTLLDIMLVRDGTKVAKPWLAVVLDDYSRAVAGYFLSFEAPSAAQTALVLRQAIWQKQDPGWHVCGIPEFVEGETLENLIKRSGRLEVKLALEIATQVAAGLAAVHKQKLVHRDIKPSNIIVSLEVIDRLTKRRLELC